MANGTDPIAQGILTAAQGIAGGLQQRGANIQRQRELQQQQQLQQKQLAMQQAEFTFNKAKGQLNAALNYLDKANLSPEVYSKKLNELGPLFEVVTGQNWGQLDWTKPENMEIAKEGTKYITSYLEGKTTYPDMIASVASLRNKLSTENQINDFDLRMKNQLEAAQMQRKAELRRTPTTEKDRLDRQFMQGMLNLFSSGDIAKLDDVKNPIIRKKFEDLAPDFGIDLTAAEAEGPSFWRGALQKVAEVGGKLVGGAVSGFKSATQPQQPAPQPIQIPGVSNPTQEDIDWWNSLTDNEKNQVRTQYGG